MHDFEVVESVPFLLLLLSLRSAVIVNFILLNFSVECKPIRQSLHCRTIFCFIFQKKKFICEIDRILPHHRPNWTMNNQMCPAHNFRAFAFIRSNLSFDVMWIKSIFVCYAIASLIIFESLLLTRYVNAFSNDVNTPPNEVDSLTFQPKMYQLPAQQP